ncbi:sigma-70 family RNA polymerase sigma factor [bacterium]|nr:sigma-70 family RNA polymerase sigma factor [bacterium]
MNLIGELYLRYSNQILLVCSKYFTMSEAEDTTMEIFERLPDQLIKFNVKNFKSWLLSVTNNFCRSKINRNNKIEETSVEYIEEFSESFVEKSLLLSLMDENNNDNREHLYAIVADAFDELDVDQKLCIDLFYVQEKSYKEIEEITQWSFNQIKSHIQNGRRNLRAYIEKKNKNNNMEVDTGQVEDISKIFMEKLSFLRLMYENYKTDSERLEQLIKEAFNRLEETQKLCLDLFYIQEKSYKEIQEITQLSYNQIKNCIEKGRNNIKDYIDRKVNNHEPL